MILGEIFKGQLYISYPCRASPSKVLAVGFRQDPTDASHIEPLWD